MSVKFTDVEYEDLNSNIFYTAVQVAEMIDETVNTVRAWSKDSAFGDILDIKRVNGRRVYTMQDVENLKFVKELRRKNYSIAQTREYISKKGFKFGEFDGGLVDQKDPLGYTALAIKITEQNDKKLMEFQKQQELMLDNFKNSLISELGEMLSKRDSEVNKLMDEVCVALDETIPNALSATTEAIRNELTSSVDQLLDTKLQAHTERFEAIQSDITKSNMDKDAEISNQLKQILELRKSEVEKSEQNEIQKKGFLGRLFGK